MMQRQHSMQAQARKIIEITVASFVLAGAVGLSAQPRSAHGPAPAMKRGEAPSLTVTGRAALPGPGRRVER